MTEILKEAAEARKYSISLRNLEYGDSLLQKMKTHGSKLEVIYGHLQDLKTSGTKVGEKFSKFYDIYDHMHKWYVKAEARSPKLNTFLLKAELFLSSLPTFLLSNVLKPAYRYCPNPKGSQASLAPCAGSGQGVAVWAEQEGKKRARRPKEASRVRRRLQALKAPDISD